MIIINNFINYFNYNSDTQETAMKALDQSGKKFPGGTQKMLILLAKRRGETDAPPEIAALNKSLKRAAHPMKGKLTFGKNKRKKKKEMKTKKKSKKIDQDVYKILISVIFRSCCTFDHS